MAKKFLMLLIIDQCLEDDNIVPKKRKLWCQDWYLKRQRISHANLLKELRVSAPKDLKKFLRMDSRTYDILLNKVQPLIKKQNTVMRDAITPNERLSATLRFLASTQSLEDLKFLTRISPQCLGKIIIETGSAIIEVLKEYIKVPQTEQEWKILSEEFGDRWNFPHCMGAMDGKHVQIKKPNNSGSYYYNYKKAFSIVLFAIVNAKYEFIMIEAGANGRVSDAGVFSNSAFYEKFKKGKLRIPSAEPLDNFAEELPFVFVGDDAFPLNNNIMKPFSGEKLTNEQIIFNYRLLSRARRIVENAFGILAMRFRILLSAMNFCPEKASIITFAACYLHNFLRANNSNAYLRGSVDIENTMTGEIQEGAWRAAPQNLLPLEPVLSRNSTDTAKEIRKRFCAYFNGVGAVPWQIVHIN